MNQRGGRKTGKQQVPVVWAVSCLGWSPARTGPQDGSSPSRQAGAGWSSGDSVSVPTCKEPIRASFQVVNNSWQVTETHTWEQKTSYFDLVLIPMSWFHDFDQKLKVFCSDGADFSCHLCVSVQ